MTEDRASELAERLRTVRRRLADAERAAGRAPGSVRLVAVTKNFPAEDVALLADLGLTEFGESRDQEARPKIDRFAELRSVPRPTWHMVGRLQRNKARAVARWADVVHSVDSTRLVEALRAGVRVALDQGHRSRPLDVLVQVSLDEDADRGGCPPGQATVLAENIAQTSELRLRGVMAVAPLGGNPLTAFHSLASVSDQIQRHHPGATEVSAGMSGDMEHAIAAGSTLVRVGTGLLGTRKLASP
ncbi:YggS family pyridoxal phosphate-dependent enzyme [Actinoalloteichus spitiensis]|uniref:YggS family pyridoxal phosphate-dependent enzyme n=1 Tax=Actinoalloteichus spitiensis TaxID=252394 RepID=UPI00036551E5|nr:YggS family pyridoxal phosphate-dependent enzyme [Actinoalloteichus spitiensis]